MDTSVPDVAMIDSKPEIATAADAQDEQENATNGSDASSRTRLEVESNPKLSSQSAATTSERAASPQAKDVKDVSQEPQTNGHFSSTDKARTNGVDEAGVDEAAITPEKAASATVGQAKPQSSDEKPNVDGPPKAEPADDSENKAATSSEERPSGPSEDIVMAEAPASADEPAAVTADVEEEAVEGKVEESSAGAVGNIGVVDSLTDKAEVAKVSHEDQTIDSQEQTVLPTSDADLGSSSMSQPVIETAEQQKSPAEASIEISMADAPNLKPTREREDDDSEGPAPKRARTEPKDDEPASEATEGPGEVVVSGPELPGLTSSALDELSNWSDEETIKRSISAYQRREMRKVIGRVKKTKAGHNFRDSVQKMWPALWDSYNAKIERPMDLAELERGLRDLNGPYNTYGEFRLDLRLIFDNSLEFNGPSHDITASAATTVRSVWEEILPIPSEEPVKPKAVPKPKPVRESRAVASADAARRQSAGPTASPAADAPAAAPAAPASSKPAAAPAQAAPVDRRGSTVTEVDRPKRTVRAPKSKDIDYTTKSSRKKLKPELQFAEEVLTEIMSNKHQLANQWFLHPVDAEGLGIPDYYSIIKKPMDLSKVATLLSEDKIASLKEFDKAVRLIFDNCYKFNGPVDQGNQVSIYAKNLEDLYVAQMKGKDAWLAKYAKANAPASASNASDEDDDDDDDDGEDGPDVLAVQKDIAEVQARLEEETKKLNNMLLTPNKSMIDVQRSIVEMVQKTLMSKAAEVQAARAKAKSDKPKKSGKSNKTKGGGSGARKSSGAAGQAKKSKKVPIKKSLTAVEKDEIANAINDLEHPHLDRAIDIIKRDTGQNENNDGELELEIDQLSTDALLKLWELCKKVLPDFAKDSAPAADPTRSSTKQSSQASAAAKNKKNKPMNAQEQEARIVQLTALSHLYTGGAPPKDGPAVTQAPTPGDDQSSDDSDSEEE